MDILLNHFGCVNTVLDILYCLIGNYHNGNIIVEVNMIASRLKEAREKAGYMQKEVADALGCTPVTISRYETGIRQPDEAALVWYATHCNVSLDYIFGLTDNPIPKRLSTDSIDISAARQMTDEQLAAALPEDVREAVLALIRIEKAKEK